MEYDVRGHLYGNFMQYEVARSATAARLGIDNTPDDDDLENAYQVAKHILQPVRDAFGKFSPSSWFRCEELERVITRQSFKHWCDKHGLNADHQAAWEAYFMRKSHPKGEAVDFEIVGVDNNDLFTWCVENIKDYDQLIQEFMKPNDPAAGWVHASYSVQSNRRQVIKIT